MTIETIELTENEIALAKALEERNQAWQAMYQNSPSAEWNDWPGYALANAKYRKLYFELNWEYPNEDEVDFQAKEYRKKFKYGKD